MKTKIFLMACVAMLTLGTSQVQAQGLGGLLKKGKKALETVNKALGDETNNNTQSNTKTNSSGSTLALENGGTLTNPMPQIIDVQLVGVYGKSTSTNYGTVHLVFKVKMIENRNSISFEIRTIPIIIPNPNIPAVIRLENRLLKCVISFISDITG